MANVTVTLNTSGASYTSIQYAINTTGAEPTSWSTWSSGTLTVSNSQFLFIKTNINLGSASDASWSIASGGYGTITKDTTYSTTTAIIYIYAHSRLIAATTTLNLTTAAPTNYTITYNARTGTASKSSDTGTYGSTVTIPTWSKSSSTSTNTGTWTFDANGGVFSGTTTTKAVNTTSNTTTSYTFTRWIDGDANEYQQGDTYTIYGDDTVSAYYNSNSSTVFSTITAPNMPTRTGYTFKGWGDGTTVLWAAGATITPTILTTTIYAVWELKTYTVTFNAGTGGYVKLDSGSSGSTASLTVTYGTTYSTDSNVLTIDSHTVTASSAGGYHFSSWSSTSGTITSDTTITASFALNSYYISITNDGNSTTTPASDYYQYNQSLSLACTPNVGYEFVKWTVKYAQGSEQDYSTDASTTFSVGATTAVLKAYCQLKTYTVTFTAGTGGSVSPTEMTDVPYGAQITPSSNTVTIKYSSTTSYTCTATASTSYNFSDWSGIPSDRTVTGNLTITANFAIKTYTISYNANGGSGSIADQTKTYGVDLTLSDGTGFTRSGYELDSWCIHASSETLSDYYALGGTYSNNSNATMYAQWVPYYWVQIDAGIGGSVDYDSFTVYNGTTYSASGNVLYFYYGSTLIKTVTATPGTSWLFDAWESTSGTIESNKTIRVSFKRVNTITYYVNDSNKGSISLNTGYIESTNTFTVSGTTISSVSQGTTYSNTATPHLINPSCEFDGWYWGTPDSKGSQVETGSSAGTLDKSITAWFKYTTMSQFDWTSSDTTNIITGQPISNITALKWNTLGVVIQEACSRCGLSFTPSTVEEGDAITATLYNTYRNKIADLITATSTSATIRDAVSQGSQIMASYFFVSGETTSNLSLKGAINAVINKLNS